MTAASISHTAHTLHIFTDGRTIGHNITYTVGVPMRISGELALALKGPITSVDLLVNSFFSGTRAARVTIDPEPERGSCLLVVHEEHETGDLLLRFALACADAAVLRRAGAAYYRASAEAVRAIEGRRLHMQGQISDQELAALSAAAARYAKPYNGAIPGTPYYSMYSVDGDGVQYLNDLAADLASNKYPLPAIAMQVARIGRAAAGNFVEALAWKRRAENAIESGRNISLELGGEMSLIESLSRAASRGTPRFDPRAVNRKGADLERDDQNDLLAKLLSSGGF
jgi:hypothetical protein